MDTRRIAFQVAIYLLLFIAPVHTVTAAHTFTLLGSPTQEGTLLSYEQGWFTMKNSDGATVRIREQRVQNIEFDEPVNALVVLDGRKDLGLVSISKYEHGTVFMERQGNEERHLIRKIKNINVSGLPTQRTDLPASATMISKGEEVDLAQYVHADTLTIIHFHSSESSLSTSLQAYLLRLYTMHPNSIALYEVDIAAWADPVVRQHDISVVPQIWIYDRNGNLYRRLEEQITTRDIDAALEGAQKIARMTP